MNNIRIRDTFKVFLVAVATFCGFFEFPEIKPTHDIPNRVIKFSKALSCKDCDQWIHFYEDDSQFERVWNNPRKYLNLFKRFNGVILPDFSLYRDMPLVMQLWNIYRSRAIGTWLQANGIKVIPNIRYGDYRTFRCCCDGISSNCTIAVGSNGTVKHKDDRDIFFKGLDVVTSCLKPETIVIYGTVSHQYFEKYREKGIKLIFFDSEYTTSRKEVV